MILSKGLTRLGLFTAVAALVLGLSIATTGTASAQTPPANFYGKGLRVGDRVEAKIGAAVCGSTTANAAGEWAIQVQANAACAPTAGAAVTFTLNGGAATSTPAATWQGGGLPPDVANGYVLAASQATATPTAAAVVPPKTGNAGMLGSSSASSTWVVLAIALVAAGAVAGTRVVAGRAR